HADPGAPWLTPGGNLTNAPTVLVSYPRRTIRSTRQTGAMKSTRHTTRRRPPARRSVSAARQRGHPGLPSCNGVVWVGARRPASRSAVPQRQASRGVLRVGARSPRTELRWGEHDFSSVLSLADRMSAVPLYATDLRELKSSDGCTGQATKGD